jgi:hypothetical protein
MGLFPQEQVGCIEDLRKDPFRTDQCEVCLRAKIERYPKDGEAPQLRGGANGIGLDIDLAGPLDTSMDGHRYLFVGVERASGTIFAVPIGSKAEAIPFREDLAKLWQAGKYVLTRTETTSLPPYEGRSPVYVLGSSYISSRNARASLYTARHRARKPR